MTILTGIILAFISMLCWGLGDFLIQKSTRKMGDWETLFIITGFGSIVLFPFAIKPTIELFYKDTSSLLVLVLASVVIFVASIINFEALKRGKLSVVEPIWSFEIIMTSILALLILNEKISYIQLILIFLLLISLALVAFREKKINLSFFLEKGAILAVFGAITMGSANFLMGWSGRLSDPVTVIFFTNIFIAVITGIYLLLNGKINKTFFDLRKNYKLLIPMSIYDNVAWLAFVFAMTLAPIGIVTAFSESYIIIAVILGLMINREKLQIHQKIGLFCAIIFVLLLVMVTA